MDGLFVICHDKFNERVSLVFHFNLTIAPALYKPIDSCHWYSWDRARLQSCILTVVAVCNSSTILTTTSVEVLPTEMGQSYKTIYFGIHFHLPIKILLVSTPASPSTHTQTIVHGMEYKLTGSERERERGMDPVDSEDVSHRTYKEKSIG